MYASWNGATEVRSWQLLAGPSANMHLNEPPESVLVASDFTPFAQNLKDAGADWVFSWAPWVTEIKTLESLRKLGWEGRYITWAHIEAEAELAQLLVDAVPSLEMVRFVNSGTEATMSAIRLARGVTGRRVIVKFAGCYHGHVDALLAQAGSGVATLAMGAWSTGCSTPRSSVTAVRTGIRVLPG